MLYNTRYQVNRQTCTPTNTKGRIRTAIERHGAWHSDSEGLRRAGQWHSGCRLCLHRGRAPTRPGAQIDMMNDPPTRGCVLLPARVPQGSDERSGRRLRLPSSATPRLSRNPASGTTHTGIHITASMSAPGLRTQTSAVAAVCVFSSPPRPRASRNPGAK